MKPFVNSMTQTSPDLSGWTASIALHVCVFFALFNTPMLQEYANHPSFFTVHLINEETSLNTLHKRAKPDASVSLPETTNNKLVTYHPTQQPAQENSSFKRVDKRNLASIPEELRYGDSSKNHAKQAMSILPTRKPKKLAMVNKAKPERVNRKFNNETLSAAHSEKIFTHNPLNRKDRKEKTLVTPSGKKPDKKLTIKPLINLSTKSNFDEYAELRKTLKISSSTGIGDLVPDNENVGPVLKELSLPFKKSPNKVSVAKPQKNKAQNKQHFLRPILDGPHGEVVTTENYEKTLSSFKQNRSLTPDVKTGVKKNLLKTWGMSVRNDVVKRTLESQLSRDIKIVLKISKTGELLNLEIMGSPSIDKNIENFINTIKTSGNFPSAPDGLKLEYVNFPINFLSSG